MKKFLTICLFFVFAFQAAGFFHFSQPIEIGYTCDDTEEKTAKEKKEKESVLRASLGPSAERMTDLFPAISLSPSHPPVLDCQSPPPDSNR